MWGDFFLNKKIYNREVTVLYMMFINNNVDTIRQHPAIGGTGIVAPIYWCKQMVKIVIIVSTLNIMVLQV